MEGLTHEERVRQAALLSSLRDRCEGLVDHDWGFEMRLPDDPAAHLDAFELALLERRRCPALEFAFRVESEGGPVWLVLRGDAQVRRHLAAAGWPGP
jgi:hypothetical protein